MKDWMDTTEPKTSAPSKPKVVTLPVDPLSKPHRTHMYTSGLTDETLELAGIRTARDSKDIKRVLGLRVSHNFGGGIVIPYRDPEGKETWQRVRPDQPRTFKSSGKSYSAKYESPKGSNSRPYIPPRTLSEGRLGDETKVLIFCEGEKKALLLDQLGYAVVAGPGVDGFHSKTIRESEGVKRIDPLYEGSMNLRGRHCVILFDADAHEKPEVMGAIKRLAGILEAAGGAPYWTTPPADGDAKGIDDYYLAEAGEEGDLEKGAAAVQAVLRAAKRVVDPADPRDLNSPLTSVTGLTDVPVDPALRFPLGYKHSNTGLWAETGEGKDDIRVMDRTVIPSRVLLDVHTGEERIEVVFRRRGRWRTAVVDRTALGQSRTLIETLRPLGANVDATNAMDVVRWIASFEELNEAKLPRVACTDRCGWHKLDDEWCIVAPHILKNEGLTFDGSGGRASIVRGLGTPKGASLDAHRDALCRAWNASPIAAATICAALAVPLLRVLGVASFGFSLFGDSSTGKSTMAKVAASIYGDPTANSWFPSWNGTQVGHEVRAQVLGDLPFFVDEVGSADARSREKFLYMLMNGVGKIRGAKAGGLRETVSWNTIVISTGETSMVPDNAATGAAVRVIELYVDGFGPLDAAGVDALRDAACENYGAIGKLWLETIVEMDRETVVGLRKEYRELVTEVRSTAANGSLAARQSAQVALLVLVESLAKEWLNVGDDASVSGFFRSMQAKPEAQLKDAPTRAYELVMDWMSSQPGAFPVLVPESGSGRLVPESSRAPQIYGYQHDGFAYLIPTLFKAKLAEHGMAERPVVAGWKSQGRLKSESGRAKIKKSIGGIDSRFVALRLEHVMPTQQEFNDDP